MRCDTFRDRAFELARGELSGEAEKETRRHLNECQRCREEYGAVLKLVEGLGSLGDEPAPQTLLPNVMKKISAAKAVRRRQLVRFGSAAAAAVVLVVGAVSVMPRLTARPGGDEEIPVQQRKMEEDELTADSGVPAVASLEDAAASEGAVEEPVEDENAEAQQPEEVTEEAAVEEPVTEEPSAEEQPAPTEEAVTPETAFQAEETAPPAQPTVEEVPQTAPEDTAAQSGDTAAVAYDYEAGGNDAVVLPLPENAKRQIAAGEDTVESADAGKNTKNDTALTSGAAVRSSGGGSGGAARKYVCRRVSFTASGENAAAAYGVNPAGKSMEQVAGELAALGVNYSVSVKEDDMSAEYASAGPGRRAEIEALCQIDQCSIAVRE